MFSLCGVVLCRVLGTFVSFLFLRPSPPKWSYIGTRSERLPPQTKTLELVGRRDHGRNGLERPLRAHIDETMILYI